MTDQPSYFIDGCDRTSQFVVLCDHASNRVPLSVGNGSLGLPDQDMARHIAYDIGAAPTAKHLGRLLNAPVICSNFSRLVIDPNRGEDDPTLLMRLYDGTLIPENRYADEVEKQRRLDAFHRPYRTAAHDLVETRQNPVIISLHSFTPQLRGRAKRIWELGVLFARDKRFSAPLIEILQDDVNSPIGINQPYSGDLTGDTMDVLALRKNHLHALLEIRNDLIESEAGQRHWAEILAKAIKATLETLKE